MIDRPQREAMGKITSYVRKKVKLLGLE